MKIPAEEDASTSDLFLHFVEVARSLMEAGSTEATLALVIELATTEIDGCDFAGILDVNDATSFALHSSDVLVPEIEALQIRFTEGPSFAAISGHTAIYVEDFAEETRWASFSSAACECGIRSVFSAPLSTDDPSTALNFYARTPRAFDIINRAKALLLGSLADLSLHAARVHEDDTLRAKNLLTALESREVIAQAQGILMERDRISAEEAFHLLVQASQQLNVKLREVALRLVETGENPAGATFHSSSDASGNASAGTDPSK